MMKNARKCVAPRIGQLPTVSFSPQQRVPYSNGVLISEQKIFLFVLCIDKGTSHKGFAMMKFLPKISRNSLNVVPTFKKKLKCTRFHHHINTGPNPSVTSPRQSMPWQ